MDHDCHKRTGGVTEAKYVPQVDTVLDRALREPVIRSAVGIVRESAGLLYHIAGLGIALVSGPEISRRQHGSKQTRSAAPNSANVIHFPNSKRQATGQD